MIENFILAPPPEILLVPAQPLVAPPRRVGTEMVRMPPPPCTAWRSCRSRTLTRPGSQCLADKADLTRSVGKYHFHPRDRRCYLCPPASPDRGSRPRRRGSRSRSRHGGPPDSRSSRRGLRLRTPSSQPAPRATRPTLPKPLGVRSRKLPETRSASSGLPATRSTGRQRAGGGDVIWRQRLDRDGRQHDHRVGVNRCHHVADR